MSDYKIISDSSCDLTEKYVSKYDIEITPFYISFDSEKYYKEGIDIGKREFYQRIRAGEFAKTSLQSIQDFIDKFTPYLEQKIDIINFCLSSGLSGAYQSAVNAKNILHERYPERKIEIIDSRLATIGQGQLVIECCKMKEAGIDFEKNIEIIKKISEEVRIAFTVDTLSNLLKGGRIGTVAAIAGTVLNIKPIIYLSNGVLLPEGKVRSRKKALQEVVKYVERDLKGKISDYNVVFLHSDSEEECMEFKKSFIESHPDYNVLDDIFEVGVTIGSHTGATAMAISYCPKYEIYL